MSKNVLLISPSINNLYKDIISQLMSWGMVVDYIEDKVETFDPNYIRNGRHFVYDNIIGRSYTNKVQHKKWVELLNRSPYDKKYDYLLVIDGLMLSKYLFDELRTRNPNIWTANYLFDSTRSLYRFQFNFEKFDIVASFDRKDCKEYNLLFLPIYWCESEQTQSKKYDLFGFGTYGLSRYNIFKSIEEIAKAQELNCYIKLYCKEIKNFQTYEFKRKCKQLLGLNTFISAEHYYSDLITHKLIPSEEFRSLIYVSNIIVDSVNFDQDGMTARFMWALGAGKKIITTNTNIMEYNCYTPEQIFVVDDERNLLNNQSFLKFLQSDFTLSEYQKKTLLPWRLDKWLATLLNL